MISIDPSDHCASAPAAPPAMVTAMADGVPTSMASPRATLGSAESPGGSPRDGSHHGSRGRAPTWRTRPGRWRKRLHLLHCGLGGLQLVAEGEANHWGD